MGFRIDPADSVEGEFRRVAAEQFDAAGAVLEGPGPDEVVAAVHDARKRAKRLRALFRLVRSGVPTGELAEVARPDPAAAPPAQGEARNLLLIRN